ncbi:MAG: chemotaxis protein CheW [Gemmatimonadaceae bacterium]
MATTLDPTLRSASPLLDEASRELDATPRLTLRSALAEGSGVAELLLFRVDREHFAMDLAAVDEALELPDVHEVPESPSALLGVFHLRERLVPVYSPMEILGVALGAEGGAALVMRAGERRVGVAVDDVEDVLSLDVSLVQRSPVPDAGDNVLLGVALHGGVIVSLIDAAALVSACAAQLPGEDT